LWLALEEQHKKRKNGTVKHQGVTKIDPDLSRRGRLLDRAANKQVAKNTAEKLIFSPRKLG
jgi:hypothetical protein